MPIFVNHSSKYFIFTSYKVAFTTLKKSCGVDLKYLHCKIDFPIFKHLLRHYNYKRYLIIRHPYSRFSSLFADKYRKLPLKILEGKYNWEKVHKLLYKHLNISETDSDNKKYNSFMQLDIHNFINYLPEIIFEDEHFQPQYLSYNYLIFNKVPISPRIDKIFKIETEAKQIFENTGINFSERFNTSNSTKILNNLTRNDFNKLSSLYKKDFKLGLYENNDIIKFLQ